MIWSDPWIEVATTPSIYRPLCTRLPPPQFTMHEDIQFKVYNMNTSSNSSLIPIWNKYIQTSWTTEQLKERLQNAWIACIQPKQSKSILATCVLRNRYHDGVPFCILETLYVTPTQRHKGYGALLMRCVMRWLWEKNGPFILGYIWELTPSEFMYAWWRGWLSSVAEIRLGWSWKSQQIQQIQQQQKQSSLPLRFHTQEGDRFVVISDSGLGDGIGYIQDCSGTIDWNAIAVRGGWKGLWSSIRQSKEWKWSGEIVVIGLLNYCGQSMPSFRSPEITPRRQRTDADDSHEEAS